MEGRCVSINGGWDGKDELFIVQFESLKTIRRVSPLGENGRELAEVVSWTGSHASWLR